ncbi:hypothetical protein [Thalassoglobus polymorphus]|uniref:Carboxypeptidase regulatory-like domain-containing protein n=1 Tax=Thalassoglobus polymorphus TaxID=2527994 RepID=A0A517QLE3_9PLAN|nr:hypothetical protein [Thalassoglobus polymorphus]QDT32462.1 hypothetical protein Mal48_17080 [Thalassoglobus polymorphus]
MRLPLLYSLAFMVGCSGGADLEMDKLKTVPASGKLTIDGSPFGPATIDLIPLDSNERVRAGSAQVEEDGSFTVGTYDDDDGIVPGSYTVRVSVPLDSASPAPNVEYFEFTVGNDGDEEIALDLKKGAGAGGLLSPDLDGGGTPP